MAEQGQVEEGIAQVRQGIAAYRATGAEVHWRIQSLVALAEVCLKVGRTGEGLSALDEATDFMNSHDERWLEAEVYRLYGELTLQKEFGVRSLEFGVEDSPESRVQSPESSKTKAQILDPKAQSEAEGCFLKAIDIAQKQQAKSLELRAVMSLARLWQQQCKTAEARQRLAEIYGWFTEGFDTKDLQEAKMLLAELHQTGADL